MRHRNLTLALLVPILAACGNGTSTPPAASPSASTAPPRETRAGVETKVLDADTPITTGSGATFEGPKGWTVTKRTDGVIVLTAPENDLTLAFVESDGNDGDAAIAAAWKKLDPAFARSVEMRSALPPRDGWDALTQIAYVTPATESRAIVAVAMRKAEKQYVALIDGSTAGLSRRGAQLQTTINTFKAKGVEEESFAGKKANVLDSERLSAFAAFIEEARAIADVPGVAVAVVQGDKVVMAKGFGVREAGKKAAVTPKSLFLVGSTTKSLTTLMMAKLVDEKKVAWTTPMTELLPTFALGDADATKRLTLADTVCACTGLPRQDMEMFFHYRARSAEKTLESMRTMKPTTAFGETFQYSNTMVLAGGLAAAHVAEPKRALSAAYDATLRSRILEPLGMRATTLDFAAATRSDYASPHGRKLDLAAQAMPPSADDFVAWVAPSGGAWSNAEDMAKVLRLELARGQLDGKRIISEENLLARRAPRVKITDKASYGLGLFIEKEHGVPVLHHGGNTLGFTSDMFFLPDHDVGVVVLANAGSANAFRSAMRRRFLELLFDGRAEAMENLKWALERRKEAYAKDAARVTTPPNSAWVTSLAGRWTNASLGAITIRKDKELALLDAGDFKVHFGEKTGEDGAKSIFGVDPPWMGLELLVEQKDGTTTLLLDAAQQKYVFTREGAASK